MKKCLSVFVLTLVLISSTLLAFDNKYFSVNDEGWTNESTSEEDTFFTMEDFQPITDEEILKKFKDVPPNVCVKIFNPDNEDTYYYAEYDQEELKQFKDVLGEFSQIEKQTLKEAFIKNIEKEKQLNDNEKEALFEKIFPIEIVNADIGKIGEHKAFVGNFKVGKVCFRAFKIITLKHIYIVYFKFMESAPIDDFKVYKEFVKSFKAKDSEGSKFNSYLHAYGLTALILLLAGAEFVYKIIKKKNSDEEEA